jgi:hypothetical protein
MGRLMSVSRPGLASADILAGLRLTPSDPRAAAKAAGVAVVAVTLGLVACDAAFRNVLPAWYVAAFANPDVTTQLWGFIPQAAAEELKFRLIGVSAVVVVGRLLFGGRAVLGVVAVAILASALLNIAPGWSMMGAPPAALWYGLRFLVPQLVWGWLYWRHGFVTALIAHPLCHLALDPLLLALLG